MIGLLGVGGATSAMAQLSLIQSGAVWRYFDSGLSPGLNWASNSFDAGAWRAGPAPLGYGNGGEATVVAVGVTPRPVTIYFRHEFVRPEPTGINALLVRLACDDGAVVYLNGTEVYRRNLAPGAVQPGTFASARVDGLATKQFSQYPAASFWARPGTNVVAVELHQHSAGLADAWFDLEWIANLPLSLPEIRLTSPTPGAVLPTGPVRFEVETSDRDGFVYLVRYSVNSWPAGESSSAALDFVWTPARAGRYRVVAEAVDNSGRRRESEPVYFQVGDVNETRVIRGPYLQSGSSTGLVVRWRTDWPTDSWVRYGAGPSDLDFLATGAPGVEHEVRLTGLRPETPYFYSVGTAAGPTAGGTGVDFQFRTAPEVARPVRIWAIGDSGKTNATPAAVRDAYLNLGGWTDLWLLLGDNAYEEGTDDQYQVAVFDMYPMLLRNTLLWTTLGNHDAAVAGRTEAFPYLEIFSLPRHGEAGGVASGTELYYSFDYANLHLVCLDAQSSDRSPGGPMLTWLENDLAATAKDWIIAFWHHPPYTWGSHNSDRELNLIEMRQFAGPILERYGVDLVLCGHSHVYERSYLLNGHYGFSTNLEPAMILDAGTGSPFDGQAYRKPSGGLGAQHGTAYVVCGCSGEGGVFNFPQHPAMARHRSGYGSMVIDVDGLRLDARFLSEQGEVADWFAIDKRGPGPAVSPRLEIRPAGAGVELSWPTAAIPFQLERRPGLGPLAPWAPVVGTPGVLGRSQRLWRPVGASNELFRLRGVGP